MKTSVLLLLAGIFFNTQTFAQAQTCEQEVKTLEGFSQLQPDIQQMAIALASLKDQGTIKDIKSASQDGLTRGIGPCLNIKPLANFSDIGYGTLTVIGADGKDLGLTWNANHIEQMTKDKWLNGSTATVSNGHVGFNAQIKKGGTAIVGARCKFMKADGLSEAKDEYGEVSEGKAALYMSVPPTKASTCQTTTDGKKRVWPDFCAAMISCDGKPAKLTVCPNARNDGKYGCVIADDCANAQDNNDKNPKTYFNSSKVAKNDKPAQASGYAWTGETRVVTVNNVAADAVSSPICVGQFIDANGSFGLGTGTVAANGTCNIADMANDKCISMRPSLDKIITNRYIYNSIELGPETEAPKAK